MDRITKHCLVLHLILKRKCEEELVRSLARLRIIFNYFNAASECRLFFFVPSLFFHSSRTKIWILNLALGFIRYEGSCGLFMGGFLSFLDVIEPLCYDVVALWSHIQDHISYCIYHVCISLIIAHIILHIMISECRIRVSHIVTVLVLNILLHELN